MNYPIFITENFFLFDDTEYKNPISKKILDAILSKLPGTSSANSLPQIEASGAEGIVFSLDDYRVIKLFFSIDNALKSAPLISKSVNFTSKVFSTGKIILDKPVVYFRRNSSYSRLKPIQTKELYYTIMERVTPDEETYSSVEEAYDENTRISKLQFEDLAQLKSVGDISLNERISEILKNFLEESDINTGTDQVDYFDFINSLPKKEKNILLSTKFSIWKKTKTKEFIFLNSDGSPLLLKHFILNSCGAISTVNFDINLIKNFLFSKKEFLKKQVIQNFLEIENLIKEIVVDSKISWRDIHKGQFGRNKNNELVALDIGTKPTEQNSSFFEKNVSQISLRGKSIKLVENLERKIKKINFFDFDKTLFYTDGPDEGKKKFERIYGKKYPHIGWISKPESLDLSLDIKPIKSTLKYYHLLSDNDAINVLLSDRLPKMAPYIQNILNEWNIHIDEYLLNTGPHKTERIKDFIENYPGIVEINIFDDKDSVLKSHQSLKDLYEIWRNDLKINIFKVDGEKVYLV